MQVLRREDRNGGNSIGSCRGKTFHLQLRFMFEAVVMRFIPFLLLPSLMLLLVPQKMDRPPFLPVAQWHHLDCFVKAGKWWVQLAASPFLAAHRPRHSSPPRRLPSLPSSPVHHGGAPPAPRSCPLRARPGSPSLPSRIPRSDSYSLRPEGDALQARHARPPPPPLDAGEAGHLLRGPRSISASFHE